MEHELKIWPQYYQRVADGSKTFEIRKNDRGFQAGDTVTLYYYEPDRNYMSFDYKKIHPSKPGLSFKIGYVLPLDAERVVFSLLPLEKTNPALG